jgi:hypothetical protein
MGGWACWPFVGRRQAESGQTPLVGYGGRMSPAQYRFRANNASEVNFF